jgi:hypothetical protein
VIEAERGALAAQGASPEEAAAIIAAIERFARDTAATAVAPPVAAGGWLRAGTLEAVGALPEELAAWGDGHPWGDGAG